MQEVKNSEAIENVKLKTLASCKPSEFLRQTNRIRKSAERWLKLTDIMNIRKEVPELEKIKDEMDDSTKAEINQRNAEKLQGQSRKNVMKILDNILEKYPDETLEILALCCFVEPEHVDDYPVTMYLSAFNDLLDDQTVISFFTSLIQLAQTSF